jgi:integrase
MVIVRDAAFVESMRGHRLFVIAMISLFTGLRIGEVLALRWGRVGLDVKASASNRQRPERAAGISPCPIS